MKVVVICYVFFGGISVGLLVLGQFDYLGVNKLVMLVDVLINFYDCNVMLDCGFLNMLLLMVGVIIDVYFVMCDCMGWFVIFLVWLLVDGWVGWQMFCGIGVDEEIVVVVDGDFVIVMGNDDGQGGCIGWVYFFKFIMVFMMVQVKKLLIFCSFQVEKCVVGGSYDLVIWLMVLFYFILVEMGVLMFNFY